MSTDPATATAPPTDDEIRAWARTTGRTVSVRGPVSARVRAEYEQLAAELAAGPAPDASGHGVGGARGSVSDSPAPEPARPEQQPRKVPAARQQRRRGRWAAFFGVGPPPKSRARPKTRPKPADAGPRQPVAELVANGWDRFGRWVANVNPPVGRTLSWQADYAGMVAEELVPDTPVDRVLQVAQRARGKYAAAGAVVATPLIVWQLEQPGNQPITPAGVPNPVGAAKHRVLLEGLEDCIRLQLKYLGGEGRAEKLAAQQEERAAQQAEVDRVMAHIWTEPGPPLTPEQAAAAQQQQAQHAAAAAAAAGMSPAPGFTGPAVMFPQAPDLRGVVVQAPAGARPLRQRLNNRGELEPDG